MSSEQRAAIKLCAGNGISVNKTIEMLCNVYGDTAMKKTAVYDWYRRFQNGRKDTTDDERTGRPKSVTSSNVTQIKALLDKDRRITIRELQDRVDCSYGTVFNIIHQDLNMRRLCARWIPKMLNSEQKEQRVQCCTQFLQRLELEGDDFLERIVTVDETWLNLYTPETKAQSTMWKTPGSPSPKKFKVTPSTKKQMFVVFYDVRGVVLAHAVPPGQTVNAAYYSKVIHSFQLITDKYRYI